MDNGASIMSLDFGFTDIENWETKCYYTDDQDKNT